MQSENSTILDDTITMIGRILGSELDEITVERAVVGLFFYGGQAQQRDCWHQRYADQIDPGGGMLPEFDDSDAVSRQIARPPGG